MQLPSVVIRGKSKLENNEEKVIFDFGKETPTYLCEYTPEEGLQQLLPHFLSDSFDFNRRLVHLKNFSLNRIDCHESFQTVKKSRSNKKKKFKILIESKRGVVITKHYERDLNPFP